jgi:hypothetical protein
MTRGFEDGARRARGDNTAPRHRREQAARASVRRQTRPFDDARAADGFRASFALTRAVAIAAAAGDDDDDRGRRHVFSFHSSP